MFKWFKDRLMEENKTNNEENGQPLLSVVTTTPIPQAEPIKEESSAFSEALTDVMKHKDKQSQYNKPLPPPAITPTPSVEPPPVKMDAIYEIVFINELNEEKVVYTAKQPEFRGENLFVSNCFGKAILYENILGLNEVRSSCRSDIERGITTIPLNKGVVIKSLKEESWMSLDYEATKKIFDEAVLKAYRIAAQQTASVKVKQNPIPTGAPHNNQEAYPVGNIPVNRGPLISDF